MTRSDDEVVGPFYINEMIPIFLDFRWTSNSPTSQLEKTTAERGILERVRDL